MAGRNGPSVAVIGCGPWGQNHVRVFAELGALRTACDTDPARLKAVRTRYPQVAAAASAPEVLRDREVDAVVVATPASSHAGLAAEALRAGKDVLVEKPMALSIAEAREVCELAAKHDRVLGVGHVLEYHPAIARLRELVASGELGRVRYLYANRLNFGRIRTEENVLWSFAPHDVAIMLRLMGREPETVACQGGTYVSAEVADVTVTQLRFGPEVGAHIFVSWLHPFKEHRFVVVGDRRMAVFNDTQLWSHKLVCFDHAVDWMGGQVPVARKAAGQPVPLEEREPLLEQASAFLAAVVERTPMLTDGQSGISVLRVLQAAQRSLDLRGAPEALHSGDDVYVDPTATVDADVQLGAGTKVWHYVHVTAGAVIGRDCVLGQGVFVGRGVRIGDSVRLQNSVSVFEGVTLEDHVFCGPSATFTNVRAPRGGRRGSFERTLVRSGATIGANATIVCGVTIGRHALVGAGAVVTGDVPDHALVVGCPARVAGWVCRCGERLGDALVCGVCGACYQRAGGGLAEAQ